MIIDSNTFGWLLATGIAVYICVKHWKRLIKLFIFAGASMFVLFVVQIKQMYNFVISNNNPEKNNIKYEVKAQYDTTTKTINIKDINLINNN